MWLLSRRGKACGQVVQIWQVGHERPLTSQPISLSRIATPTLHRFWRGLLDQLATEVLIDPYGPLLMVSCAMGRLRLGLAGHGAEITRCVHGVDGPSDMGTIA
jgi:hypothetical protein